MGKRLGRPFPSFRKCCTEADGPAKRRYTSASGSIRRIRSTSSPKTATCSATIRHIAVPVGDCAVARQLLCSTRHDGVQVAEDVLIIGGSYLAGTIDSLLSLVCCFIFMRVSQAWTGTLILKSCASKLQEWQRPTTHK